MTPLSDHAAEAQAFAARNGRGEPPEPFTTYTCDDLAALPPPEDLIPGVVPHHDLTGVIGASGVGKSFLTIDWSCCVATGTPWNGREVKQGPVLYIAAEGFSGLLRRVDARCAEHDEPRPEHLHFLPEVVNLLDRNDIERMQATVDLMDPSPVMVVVDTMARAMPGGDDNQSKDVGLLVHELERVCRPVGAARVIVHHPRKGSDIERGSGALRGAADAMTLLKMDGGGRKLEVTKMKNAEEGPPIPLVLAAAHGSLVVRFQTNRSNLGPHETTLLGLLQDTHGGDWTSTTRLWDTAEPGGMPKSSYYFALNRLLAMDLVDRREEGKARYQRINAAGREQLVQKGLSESNQTHPVGPRDSTTLRGGPGTDADQDLDARWSP